MDNSSLVSWLSSIRYQTVNEEEEEEEGKQEARRRRCYPPVASTTALEEEVNNTATVQDVIYDHLLIVNLKPLPSSVKEREGEEEEEDNVMPMPNWLRSVCPCFNNQTTTTTASIGESSVLETQHSPAAPEQVKSEISQLSSAKSAAAAAPLSGLNRISRRRLTSISTGATLSRISEVPCDGGECGGEESAKPLITATEALVLNFASEDQLPQTTIHVTFVGGMMMVMDGGDEERGHFCATNSDREEKTKLVRRHSDVNRTANQSTEASSKCVSHRPLSWPSSYCHVKAFADALKADAAFEVDQDERRPLLCAGVQSEPPIYWDDADIINANVSNPFILLLPSFLSTCITTT